MFPFPNSVISIAFVRLMAMKALLVFMKSIKLDIENKIGLIDLKHLAPVGCD